MQETYHLELNETVPQNLETILFNEINDKAQNILEDATEVTYYGCLHVDMLWVDQKLRHQEWGAKIMHAAENIGKERNCSFATINTMDFEALPFYQKLGYSIEFTREGYEKGSKMFPLKKKL